MTRPKEPQNLPWCEYPKAYETDKHGLQTLPEKLLPINFDNVIKYRSNRFKPAVIASEGPLKLLELASILADSFSINDPMNRHICPSRNVPVTLEGGVHRDAFGSSEFGPWTTQNIFFWFVRLFALTNANDPNHTIGIREDTVRLSLAIFDKDRNVIGAAINTVLTFKEKPIRIGDPFMQAVLNHIKPIIECIHSQEHDAMQALVHKYPEFEDAWKKHKIGMHFLVARAPGLPTNHTFELVAASAEHLRNLGYQYMVVTASNQWTGAACEVLGASRVHYLPYRNRQRLAMQNQAKDNEPFSSDGFISKKDSGMLFYILRL